MDFLQGGPHSTLNILSECNKFAMGSAEERPDKLNFDVHVVPKWSEWKHEFILFPGASENTKQSSMYLKIFTHSVKVNEYIFLHYLAVLKWCIKLSHNNQNDSDHVIY